MVRKGRQLSRKKKVDMPEEDEKKNETILEEVLSISGKNVEKGDASPPPARLKRSTNKPNEMATPQPKKNAKKRSASPQLSSPSKQKKSSDKEDEANVVNEVKPPPLERGDPVPNLPDGWRRQVAVRKSGKSAGQIDIYFYSPDGIKLRSRPDVASYLKKNKSNLKIEQFDFSKTAKTTEVVVKKKKATVENSVVPKKRSKAIEEEKSKLEEESKVTKSSEKDSAEVPPIPEKENNADVKINKDFPEDVNSVENNDKDYNSTSKKRKSQAPKENEKKDIIKEANKKLEKEDGPSSVRLKRSVQKLNEVTSTQPKKSRSKQIKSSNEDVEVKSVNEVKTSGIERGDPVPNLPDGWRREVVVRKSGERAGQIDIYFYSPDGVKLRSRPDVGSYLKKNKINLKVEDFDFSRTKTSEAIVKKKAAAEVPKKKTKTVQAEISKDEEECQDSLKNISTKVSKSNELSDKVPEEKNGAPGKSSKILRNILEKPKKLKK